MRLADLSFSGIAVELDQDGNLLIDAPWGALTPELIARISEAKPGLVAELRAAREQCELGELQPYLCRAGAENITPAWERHAPTPQLIDPNAMIRAAAVGLMTPDALRRALGTEGIEDLTAGDLSGDVLRFFAESVSNRRGCGRVLPDEMSELATAVCAEFASPNRRPPAADADLKRALSTPINPRPHDR